MDQDEIRYAALSIRAAFTEGVVGVPWNESKSKQVYEALIAKSAKRLTTVSG